jgi:hypothetical protein
MLWDCAYCGTRKLLGKTHRFCPGCGAPQDPGRRYFPGDADKVAVEDHIYVGADRHCPACDSPMAATAQHCTQCGSPMAGAVEVRRVGETASAPEAAPQAVAAPQAAPVAAPLFGSEQAPPRRRRWGLIGGLLAAGTAAVVSVLLWTRPVTATVTGHEWERTIAIESFGPRSTSDWCSAMPGDAYRVSRSRRERETRQVADGEDCSTVRVDLGDGTFREEQQCQTRYRSEPVYDDWCEYTVDRWSASREVKAAGRDLSPSWPPTGIVRTGQCHGCEREGSRKEKYRVMLRPDRGRPDACDLARDAWEKMSPGSRWKVKQGILLGFLTCVGAEPG